MPTSMTMNKHLEKWMKTTLGVRHSALGTRHYVCKKNRYCAMNYLDIRKRKKYNVASSTTNVLLCLSVSEQRNVLIFCHIQHEIGEREKNAIKNCNCDEQYEHLVINALRCRLKINRFGSEHLYISVSW